MTGKTRGLLAALVLLLVAAAGALFLSYRYQAALASSGDNGSLTVASNGDLHGILNSSEVQSQLINVAVRKLETSYYRPVDPQTPVNGEKLALRQFLAAKHVAGAGLSGDDPNAVLAYAQSHYASKLGPEGPAELTETALRGIMDSVSDPYTVYLAPKEIQGLQETLEGGNFGGIGVYIGERNGRVEIAPIDGLPAARAGVQVGEVVDTVNGKKITGLSLDAVEGLIRGEAGTQVTLTTHLPNLAAKEHRYTIVREVIHVPTVSTKMEDGIDYIRLSDFGQTSADEMKKALLDGKAHHAKGYILDLRDNGGGLLEAAVKISSYFIPHGAVVATINRDGYRDEQDALGDAIGGLGPVVILVNQYTASASEITAGALQDYHLAKLVGSKTFGKGVVQSIFPMPDLGALKITTARYVTPLGRDIQHKGIVPDVVVSLDPRLIDTTSDTQLAAAKAQIYSQIH